MPLMTIVFGDLSNTLGGYSARLISDQDFQQEIASKVLLFVYLAIGTCLTTYGYVATFTWTSENCAYRLRKSYLSAVLHQDMKYFDTEGGGSVRDDCVWGVDFWAYNMM